MPDNDSAHVSQTTPRPATNWAFATRAHGPTAHKPTARIERFIQTLQNECAYGRVYRSSGERAAALPLFLSHNNLKRRHDSLGHQTPTTRPNNPIRNYT
jgi:transposase InsO family protein